MTHDNKISIRDARLAGLAFWVSGFLAGIAVGDILYHLRWFL